MYNGENDMNEEHIFIVRCGEVALKGMNKPYFERMLAERIRKLLKKFDGVSVYRHEGLIFVRADKSLDKQAVIREISKVFGVASISPAVECESNMEAIGAAAVEYMLEAIRERGVKTFKVQLAKPSTSVNSPSPAVSLQLPFDRSCATYNAFRSAADFEGGYSYAAELLPEGPFMVNCVPFQLGERDAANGLSCRGNVIDLPGEATTARQLHLLVASDNPLIGKTVEEAGLMFVPGGSLIEIIHYDEYVVQARGEEFIMGGDRLVFAGQIDEILKLKKSHGLVSAGTHLFHMKDADSSRQLRTAYVRFGSSLVSHTIAETHFEKKHNVNLVAVARRGERIEEAPHQVVLRAGDTLLLECPPRLKIDTNQFRKDLHFFDSDDVPNIGSKTLVSTAIMIAMVVVSALGIMPLLQCAFIAAGAMLLFRCCSPEQAMKSINWDILMVFAGSVVLGLAVQKTGIAERLAFGILDVCGDNPYVVMTAVCLVATFATEFISNTAAGAMFFPIMYETAEKLGYEPYPFLIALMISESSSFATPIGSPTHILVYGPGGYQFKDFIKIGFWMNLIILAANIVITNIVYPLTPINN